MSDKPFVWQENYEQRRKRIYPHEVLREIALSTMADPVHSIVSWEILEREDAAEWAPLVREIADNWTTFATMIEAIAAGVPASECASCGSPFYPSRRDAKVCSATCRMRLHRARSRPAED